MTHFFLKPGASGQPIPYTGVGDLPGDTNFGTESAPVFFSAGAVGWWLYDNPDPEMTFHFAQGDYTVGPSHLSDGQYCQGADFIAIRHKKPPVDLNKLPRVFFMGDPNKLPMLRSYPRNYTKAQTDLWGSGREQCIIWSYIVNQYVDHIQIEYLAFDDNFLGMGYPSTEGAITHGFKLFALQLRAKTGIVRGCTVENSGASSDKIGGALAAEAFPINVYAIDPKEGAWLIENCTVKNFHSRNGGYATLIAPSMFTTNPDSSYLYPPTGDIDEWFACTVRACTMNGVPQVNGCGSAGTGEPTYYASSRILFQNNVITGCGIGSNTDTASVVRQHYICNSFIDVCCMIQLGTPTSGPTFHRNFKIDNNYVRIKGLPGAEPAPGYPVKRCGLHIRNNARGILLRDNTLDHGPAAQFGGDYFRVINLSGQDGYAPAYYGSYGPGNNDIDDWVGENRAAGTLFKGAPIKSTEEERVFGKIIVADDDRWTVT